MAKPITLTHEFQDLNFREIEPVPQWSARIALDVSYDTFFHGVLQAAEITQHRFTGTITRDTETGNVTSFSIINGLDFSVMPCPSASEQSLFRSVVQ